MEEDVMNMDVAPVMMPDQQMPQGQQMMQGTPAAPILPEQLQSQINSLSEQEKDEAKQALMQIIKILQQMEAEGATPEEIEEFLKQIGMTLEELEMAEEMFGMGEGALGFTI